MAVHIIDPCKATFIHIPKTGGTSITKWLEKNFEIDNKKKHGYMSHAKALWADLGWTFSIVRNPFDRIASSYFYQKKFYTDRLKKIQLGQAKKPHKEFWNEDKIKFIVEELSKGFEYYLTEFNNPLDLPPQADYLKNCDYVMKLENLSNDFLLVQEKLNCYKPIGIENSNNQKNYNLVYNKNTTKIIEQRYKIDFNLFY